MRDDLISFLEVLNYDMNGTLIDVDIPKYVDKIQEFATIYSIVKNRKIKAFIAFYENDENREVAFLTMIAVSKDSWHLGYGKNLLEISINDIKKKGFKLYKLEVKENNIQAIKLYEKYGFTKTGLSNGVVIMEKKI